MNNLYFVFVRCVLRLFCHAYCALWKQWVFEFMPCHAPWSDDGLPSDDVHRTVPYLPKGKTRADASEIKWTFQELHELHVTQFADTQTNTPLHNRARAHCPLFSPNVIARQTVCMHPQGCDSTMLHPDTHNTEPPMQKGKLQSKTIRSRACVFRFVL